MKSLKGNRKNPLLPQVIYDLFQRTSPRRSGDVIEATFCRSSQITSQRWRSQIAVSGRSDKVRKSLACGWFWGSSPLPAKQSRSWFVEDCCEGTIQAIGGAANCPLARWTAHAGRIRDCQESKSGRYFFSMCLMYSRDRGGLGSPAWIASQRLPKQAKLLAEIYFRRSRFGKFSNCNCTICLWE
jgi:hypothetical protein